MAGTSQPQNPGQVQDNAAANAQTQNTGEHDWRQHPRNIAEYNQILEELPARAAQQVREQREQRRREQERRGGNKVSRR